MLNQDYCLNLELEKSIKAVIRGSEANSPVDGMYGGVQRCIMSNELDKIKDLQWALHEMRKVLMDRDCVEYNFITCNEYLFNYLEGDYTVRKNFAPESYFHDDIIAVMFGHEIITGYSGRDAAVNFVRPEQCVSLRVVLC